MDSGRKRAAFPAGPPLPSLPCFPVPAKVNINPFRSIIRKRLCILSEKITFPRLSATMPEGESKVAPVPGPPSPRNQDSPLPATVSTAKFFRPTLRTRKWFRSTIINLFFGARARAKGKCRVVSEAISLSPLYSYLPTPITVVIIPRGSTLRMRLLLRSAINRFPCGSTTTSVG